MALYANLLKFTNLRFGVYAGYGLGRAYSKPVKARPGPGPLKYNRVLVRVRLKNIFPGFMKTRPDPARSGPYPEMTGYYRSFEFRVICK